MCQEHVLTNSSFLPRRPFQSRVPKLGAKKSADYEAKSCEVSSVLLHDRAAFSLTIEKIEKKKYEEERATTNARSFVGAPVTRALTTRAEESFQFPSMNDLLVRYCRKDLTLLCFLLSKQLDCDKRMQSLTLTFAAPLQRNNS